jgi:dethiobiotin synthetase
MPYKKNVTPVAKSEIGFIETPASEESSILEQKEHFLASIETSGGWAVALASQVLVGRVAADMRPIDRDSRSMILVRVR